MAENLKQLKLLFVIIPKGKKELFSFVIEKYECNLHLNIGANGTVSDELVSILGLDNKEKDIILCFLREDKVEDCILEIEDKLKVFKNDEGIAFSVPLESIIGNSNYLFMANLGGKARGGN